MYYLIVGEHRVEGKRLVLMNVGEGWWTNFKHNLERGPAGESAIEPCQPLNRRPKPACGLAPCIFSAPGITRLRGAYRMRCRGLIAAFGAYQ